MTGMRRSRFLCDARGAAAAEMALMLPLMLTLLFVAFEGGYFLWNEHKVVKGVRDGARYASRLSIADYDCDGTVDPGAETAISNLTRTGQLTGGTAVIPGWVDGNGGITVSVACQTQGGIYQANSNNAPVVTVSALVPYPSSPLTALAGALGFDVGSIHLRAEAQSPVMGL
jgi:Flp pilus assembly protein TadG